MWEIADRGDLGKIPDYVRVDESDHMVSHLHMPDRRNHMKRRDKSVKRFLKKGIQ